MVDINGALIITEVVPFGGVKQSGLGREGSYHGLEDFLDIKFLCIGGRGGLDCHTDPEDDCTHQQYEQ